MSLITLPAFLARRREETTMTDGTPAAEKVLMRFATQGGAEVHVIDRHNYPVRCLGCDSKRDSTSSVVYARDFANDHATECRSMPKSEA